ncbi:tRNA pseudouridine synthase A isoform X2 [Daktulosphaira vitifoliae]|uniref:tRNA pseudouridine synthase A isoform X2 n=1 Tax=Daktulosphaira vitifoliae TaxID=58002 RepID=UPI0021AADA52|nr:tRNA pseudouridine synthase A isoform X2 [Daktulosphaira vitifoliae]
MTLNRYLLYFSYIGTRFRGVQRQLTYDIKYNDDPSSIQGIIEYALKQLEPKNLPKLHISSRLVGAQYVSNDFNARGCVKWRKYLYRLAVLKPEYINLYYEKFVFPTPITEEKRCFFINCPDFNLDLMNDVIPLFIGTKDFKTFMAKPKLFKNTEISTIRTWNSLNILPGKSFYASEFDKYYNYLDIFIDARSFLYKQVRRTVGVLIGVAQKKLSYNDVLYMFDNPSSKSWNPRVSTAPSHGLYLYDIGYDELDLKIPDHFLKVESDSCEILKEDTLDLRKEIIKERIKKRREDYNKRVSVSLEIIKQNELFRTNKN